MILVIIPVCSSLAEPCLKINDLLLVIGSLFLQGIDLPDRLFLLHLQRDKFMLDLIEFLVFIRQILLKFADCFPGFEIIVRTCCPSGCAVGR